MTRISTSPRSFADGVLTLSLPGGVTARWTGRPQGDMRPRVQTTGAGPAWVRQVHGAEVVLVAGPGDASGSEADALVSSHPGVALAVLTADCAPVALASPEGVFGAVHAGWRGLASGVVQSALDAMRQAGAEGPVTARIGPCIHPCCYEFSEVDLQDVVAALGPTVRSATRDSKPALDLPAGVRAALEAGGVTDVEVIAGCTGCSDDWFSHRVRRDDGRQALVVSGPSASWM